MNKRLAKILVLAVLSPIVFFIFTDDLTHAAIDDEDPVATISPADGSSALPTAEIEIAITDNVGVSLGMTSYTVEKDGADFSANCTEAGDGTASATITCAESGGGLGEGSYDVSVTPADLAGRTGATVTSAFEVSSSVPTTTTTYNTNNIWDNYGGNPVMTAGAAGSWDESGVSSPSVLRASPYAMWYTGWDSSSYESIGYATSDNGSDWSKNPKNPILSSGATGSWDDYGVYNPCVIKDEGIFKMWYTGYSSTDAVFQIGYATSADGINWTKDSNNPVLSAGATGTWDEDGVGAATVIKDGTTYKMWYEGSDVQWWLRIGYATSPDGINWTRDLNNPVMSEGDWETFNEWGVAAPSVVKDGSTYHMLFIGIDGNNLYSIGHAYSPDGSNWTESLDNPHISRSNGEGWDSGDVGHPTLFKDDNESVFKVFYRGQDGSTWSIGYAVAVSLEGVVSTSTTTTVSQTTSTTTADESTTTTTPPPPPPPTTSIPECEEAEDCDDGMFCNGEEICVRGRCRSGDDPCTDDDLFCNGEEFCDETNDRCQHSGNPCQEDTACSEEDDDCLVQPPPGTTTTTTIIVFEDCMLLISISPTEGGTTSPPPPSYFAQGCSTVEVKATPNSGFKFTHWEDKENSILDYDNPITIDSKLFNLQTIIAVFVEDPCPSEQIYGEHSEETELLRYIRDNVLTQTSEGRELITLYYQWSPAIVKAMEEDEEFKEEVKEMVDGVLELIE